jgi:hypothetical protein
MTYQVNRKMIQAKLEGIYDKTGILLEFSKFNENSYELRNVIDREKGQYGRTIGRIAIGLGQAFDLVAGIDDFLNLFEVRDIDMKAKAQGLQLIT